MEKMITVNDVDFEKMSGLVPTVVQHYTTKQVLMLGFMNKAALQKTIETNLVTFYSRTKNRLWTKGEQSKNYLHLKDILVDCDNDTLLVYAQPAGNVCHLDTKTCFAGDKFDLLQLSETIAKRKLTMPKGSYTTQLLTEGSAKILAKITEESAEVVQAVNSEGRQRIIEESCDLLYHLLVLLANEDISLTEINRELSKRR